MTYSFPGGGGGLLNGCTRLFARGRLVTVVMAALDDTYTSQVAPRAAFLWGPPSSTPALIAWAHAVSAGAITAEGMQSAVWVCMVPTMRMSRVRK